MCYGTDCNMQRTFHDPDVFSIKGMCFVPSKKDRKKYRDKGGVVTRKHCCKLTTNGEYCDNECITGKDQLCKYHYNLLEINKMNTKGYGELQTITEH